MVDHDYNLDKDRELTVAVKMTDSLTFGSEESGRTD